MIKNKVELMINFVKCLLIILCFLSVSNYVSGQNTEFGVSGGLSYYIGELNPAIPFHSANLTGGFFIRHNINKRLAVRIDANYASLSAKDKRSNELPDRNAWFKNRMITNNAFLEVNFLPFYIGAKRQYFSPYLLGGFGCTFPTFIEGGLQDNNGEQINFDVNGIYGQDFAITPINNKFSMQLGFGFGVKYSLSKRIGLHVEWTMYRHFVDWIDGMYYYNYQGLFGRNNKIPLEEQEQYQIFKDKDLLYICNTAGPDWHSFLEVGLSVSFNIFNINDCTDQRRARR